MSGGAWALAGHTVAVLAALLVNALLARLLTPAHVGAYFLVLSLVSVAATVAQLGLNRTIVRLVAESLGLHQASRAARAVRLVFRLGTLGALLVAGALALGVTEWLAEYVFDSALIAAMAGFTAVWVIVLTFQGLLAESFRGLHDVRLATLVGGVVTSLLSALLLAVLWITQGYGNLQQVVALCIVAGIINILIAWPLLRSRLLPMGDGNEPSSKHVLSITWPMWITNLTLIALAQADLWVIGMFRTQEEVAIYGASIRLVAMVGVPLTIMNAVVPSFIADMYVKHAKRDLEHALRTAATGAGVVALLLFFIFFFFGAFILETVYGDYYRQGATILIILGLGQLVNVWSGSCGFVLMMTGHQLLMMGITIFSGALTITGAVLLVEPYGITGVASVTAATMLVQNVLMLCSVRLKTGIWTHARLPGILSVAPLGK
jgi:O-antigen/teichoic acid export membrane protein